MNQWHKQKHKSSKIGIAIVWSFGIRHTMDTLNTVIHTVLSQEGGAQGISPSRAHS